MADACVFRCTKVEKVHFVLLYCWSAIVTFLLLHHTLHNKAMDVYDKQRDSLSDGRNIADIHLPPKLRHHDLLKDMCDNWDFSHRVVCSTKLNVSGNVSDTRRQLDIGCFKSKKYSLQMKVNIVPSLNKSLPTLSFGGKCLRTALEQTCKSSKPVPNIVHYVWFGSKEMNFYHFLSFWSVKKFVDPCLILIHGDQLPYGKYWVFLLQHVHNIVHVKRSPPEKIHNKKLGPVEHKADIARIEAVREYGGIYLDTDEVILSSIEHLRKYNFTLSHAYDYNLSNGVIISSKNATFLYYWLEAYRNYTPEPWGHFSTIMPLKLSRQYPHLIHVENKIFVNPDFDHLDILFHGNYCWVKNKGIHLFIRKYKIQHDFEDVRQLNTTIGSVARYVLYGERNLCSN